MINNDTTSNTKLTLEQLQQIDAVEQKLTGLNTQILVANKNLKVVNNDTLRFAREIDAQKELLASLTTQIETLETKKQQLIADINESITTLDINKKQASEVLSANDAKSGELFEREKIIANKEKDLTKKEEDYNIRHSALLEDQLSIQTAKEAFLKATETVIWK